MQLTEVKTKVKKAKKFANEHGTLVACAITAVIVSKITYDVTVEHCVEKFLPILNAAEERNDAAVNAMHYTFNFLDSKGLMDEFINSDSRLASQV